VERTESDEDLLLMPEVAEMIRVPLDTLRYMRHQGTAPLGFRVGRHVLFRRGAVRAWIRERERRGAR
jgi:excisionase family DNA binding protein